MIELKRYLWCHDEQRMIEDPLGGFVRQEQVLNLKDELAKANERVKELEEKLQLTTITTHQAAFESDYGKERLKKFAIEKKVEALEDCIGVCGFLSCDDSLKARIKQLRREAA